MRVLALFFAAGAFAELVDGTLGMGFGVTNASLLLSFGLAPAAASASVHTAEVATSLASGTAHLKLGNVERKLLPWLVVPGCVGGVLGAVLLSGASASGSRPFVAAFLLVMGLLIVARTLRGRVVAARRLSRPCTAALGFSAAALDAFGGGGWGPIATPGLMLGGGHEPRKAIGTVNLAEFFVTCAITAAFLLLLGAQALRWDIVAAVALGGVLCAPVGAHLAKHVPARSLGGVVGALLVALNARTLAVDVFGADAQGAAVATVIGLCAILLYLVWHRMASRGRRRLGGQPRAPTPTDLSAAPPARCMGPGPHVRFGDLRFM